MNEKDDEKKKKKGVFIDSSINFKFHVESIVAKAHSMLGFIKRNCKEFTNLKALTSVYSAHVRSHLEYASTVWFPGQIYRINSIESVQKKYVIYALRRSIRRDANYRLPSYISRCETSNI